jgi:hypothetical protein
LGIRGPAINSKTKLAECAIVAGCVCKLLQTPG